MSPFLTQSLNVRDTTPERGVVSRVAVRDDAGTETIRGGNDVDEHCISLLRDVVEAVEFSIAQDATDVALAHHALVLGKGSTTLD